MLPPGTDFIIAYMDSLPVLKQVTAGHNVIAWSNISLIKEGGGGGGAFRTQWVKF